MFRNLLISLAGLFSLTTVPLAQTNVTEEPKESTVLEDLNKDPKFVEDREKLYPVDNNDKSVQVIHVGCNEQDEVFIYVYVPATEKYNVHFTSANISVDSKYETFRKYYFDEVSRESVFYKLKVQNLTAQGPTKYIGITSLYRSYNTDLGDIHVMDHMYDISQKWLIDMVDGKPNYYMNHLVTYVIPDSYQGYIRYGQNANPFYKKSCDGHFIAFKEDPNYHIDTLKEADVGYRETKHKIFYTAIGNSENDGYPKVSEQTKTLTYTDSVSVSNDYKFKWFKRSFTWNRIMKVSDFINQQNKDSQVLDSTAQANLNKFDFVLSFLETDYSDEYVSVPPGQIAVNHTKTFSTIDETVVLRLKFEQDGTTYNLPVVGQKHTQPEKPDGNHDLNPTPDTVIDNAKNWWDDVVTWAKEQGEGFMRILKVLLLILGLLLFSKPIEWILKALGSMFKEFFSLFKSNKKDDE